MSRPGRRRRILLAVALAGAATVAVSTRAFAHPLGNFTTNQYSGVTVHQDGIELRYVLDLAEIPTEQVLSGLGADEDTLLDAAAGTAYRDRECGRLLGGLSADLDGRPLQLQFAGGDLEFPAGAAGLHTLRLSCHITSQDSGATAGHLLTYRNHNYDDRQAGWREITVTSDSVGLAGSGVPTSSISAELTNYPNDLLSSPLDVRAASARVVTGTGAGAASPGAGAATTILPRGVDTLTADFTQLVSRRDLGIGFAGLALLAAVVLGMFHAFAPGHGKTIMAAYLVGERGDLRAASVIGLSVTATHTLGVLVLGVALSVSSSFAPERVYPILGLVSGMLVLGIGSTLLARAWRERRRRGGGPVGGHHHGDDAGHGHAHPHHHPHPGAAHADPGPGVPGSGLRVRSLFTLGFVGGLVPSPSALVVLVGAIALHRTWFGVLLVVAYGLGMAVALTGTGFLLQRVRAGLERRLADPARSRARTRRLALLMSALPLVTAAVIVVVGLGLTIRGAAAV